mmetsp:Transcript_44891/g.88044  ORF Transcript_44891/g.88044 Transcript_44891/m.88044 type:complete len:220 (-) Transcript_44891:813-1472(-)
MASLYECPLRLSRALLRLKTASCTLLATYPSTGMLVTLSSSSSSDCSVSCTCRMLLTMRARVSHCSSQPVSAVCGLGRNAATSLLPWLGASCSIIRSWPSTACIAPCSMSAVITVGPASSVGLLLCSLLLCLLLYLLLEDEGGRGGGGGGGTVLRIHTPPHRGTRKDVDSAWCCACLINSGRWCGAGMYTNSSIEFLTNGDSLFHFVLPTKFCRPSALM